jgi:hypothetical protein
MKATVEKELQKSYVSLILKNKRVKYNNPSFETTSQLAFY